MRVSGALVSLLLLVSTAAAAADDPKPDYSPQTLRQIFAHTDEWQPKPRSTVRWGLGSVEFKAFGMNWRILYLPIAMPFSGSVRGSNPSTMWPDPFALTGTEFATTPRNWHDNREISKERRRIEKSVKERAKVKVEP